MSQIARSIMKITLSHEMAGHHLVTGGTLIEVRRHLSGSGPQAFGAPEWPAVYVNVELCVDEEPLAEELCLELEKTITSFFEFHGRDVIHKRLEP